MELNLTLKLKQNPPEETWKEWIEAHAENEIKKGNYVGRAWYLSTFESYFSSKTIDEKDREILEISSSLGIRLSQSPCSDREEIDEKGYCKKYHKELGNPARKTAKCKNKHDYFSAVKACYKLE